MPNPKRNLSWTIVHLFAICSVLTSLATGLRIAILNKPYLLWFDAVLPQGELHSVHVLSALLFTATAFFYLLLLSKSSHASQSPAKRSSQQYHIWVTRLAYLLTLVALLTGWLAFFDQLNSSLVLSLHYWAALGFLLYLLLHGGAYFVEFGFPAIKRILLPELTQFKLHISLLLVGVAAFLAFYSVAFTQHHLDVNVKHIPIDQFIEIDAVAAEAAWMSTPTTRVMTHGGANFIDGNSEVEIKALENGQEIFLYIRWQDPSQSLKHLPLVKTVQGWTIKQNGFHHFNEVDFYEDKLAIMLSSSCQLGAAGTMHLGSKPLADKPANWHGKGYHYVDDDNIRDLWHWKAVRTNAMVLMDDNHIGRPDLLRPGSRRYTAGYLPDGKESGAYVMNWKWYKPGVIEPKRLPKDQNLLTPFQSEQENLDWVIPWFGYERYTTEKDNYPVGTVMPSVMYRSNRFEGDRADVRAFAVWHDGKWSLEISRKLDTGSDYDVAIEDGVCLWISAFDHSQIAHTRHSQALQFRFEVAQ